MHWSRSNHGRLHSKSRLIFLINFLSSEFNSAGYQHYGTHYSYDAKPTSHPDGMMYRYLNFSRRNFVIEQTATVQTNFRTCRPIGWREEICSFKFCGKIQLCEFVWFNWMKFNLWIQLCEIQLFKFCGKNIEFLISNFYVFFLYHQWLNKHRANKNLNLEFWVCLLRLPNYIILNQKQSFCQKKSLFFFTVTLSCINKKIVPEFLKIFAHVKGQIEFYKQQKNWNQKSMFRNSP